MTYRFIKQEQNFSGACCAIRAGVVRSAILQTGNQALHMDPTHSTEPQKKEE